MSENYGCEFRVQGEDGARINVLCAEISSEEGNTVGLSLTESHGISMRRIAIELHERNPSPQAG